MANKEVIANFTTIDHDGEWVAADGFGCELKGWKDLRVYTGDDLIPIDYGNRPQR